MIHYDMHALDGIVKGSFILSSQYLLPRNQFNDTQYDMKSLKSSKVESVTEIINTLLRKPKVSADRYSHVMSI